MASLMMPPDAANRMIGYDEKQYIGLPYNKTQMVTGNKIIFAGGKNATGYSKTADIYDVATNTLAIAQLSVALTDAAALGRATKYHLEVGRLLAVKDTLKPLIFLLYRNKRNHEKK